MVVIFFRHETRRQFYDLVIELTSHKLFMFLSVKGSGISGALTDSVGPKAHGIG